MCAGDVPTLTLVHLRHTSQAFSSSSGKESQFHFPLTDSERTLPSTAVISNKIWKTRWGTWFYISLGRQKSTFNAGMAGVAGAGCPAQWTRDCQLYSCFQDLQKFEDPGFGGNTKPACTLSLLSSLPSLCPWEAVITTLGIRNKCDQIMEFGSFW